MFLDNLSTSVLLVCEEKKLTYESAAELCDISPRYFWDIVRGKRAPTVRTLEKICHGLERTPNQLLVPSLEITTDVHRLPMQVTEVKYREDVLGVSWYAVCPRCHITMEREYQAYCDRCGQYLGWERFLDAVVR